MSTYAKNQPRESCYINVKEDKDTTVKTASIFSRGYLVSVEINLNSEELRGLAAQCLEAAEQVEPFEED